jgi:hypothetical protein
VLAAYAMQRLAFPLQDQLLANVDLALGLTWSDFAHWVDRHSVLQTFFHSAYDTIKLQIALPLVVLACTNRLTEVRTYLLAFAIAFTLTILVSALVPAAGPIVFVDRADFNILHFTGATPLDHLMRLREAGPLVMTNPPGGIATFPSFHATVAVLTPLALRGYRPIFAALLILNAAMLAATVQERTILSTSLREAAWRFSLTPSQSASSVWNIVHFINAVPSASATLRLAKCRPLKAGSGSPHATGEPIAEHSGKSRPIPNYTTV